MDQFGGLCIKQIIVHADRLEIKVGALSIQATENSYVSSFHWPYALAAQKEVRSEVGKRWNLPRQLKVLNELSNFSEGSLI